MLSNLLYQLYQLYVCVRIIWFLNQLYDHHQQGAALLLHAGTAGYSRPIMKFSLINSVRGQNRIASNELKTSSCSAWIALHSRTILILGSLKILLLKYCNGNFLCIHFDKKVFLDLVSEIYALWFDFFLSSVFPVDVKNSKVDLGLGLGLHE